MFYEIQVSKQGRATIARTFKGTEAGGEAREAFAALRGRLQPGEFAALRYGSESGYGGTLDRIAA